MRVLVNHQGERIMNSIHSEMRLNGAFFWKCFSLACAVLACLPLFGADQEEDRCEKILRLGREEVARIENKTKDYLLSQYFSSDKTSTSQKGTGVDLGLSLVLPELPVPIQGSGS